jgi:hypothetical protein
LEPPSQPSLPPPRGLDFFHPTRGRVLLAVAVAVSAFLLPQEAPLAYYPLNNPSDGLLLLGITCSASATGETQIFYDIGRSFNQLDSIRIPISSSSQPFTYTFPLPDAPIVAMRLNPLNCPGEFTITNFRIINRRGELIRRITRDDFEPADEIGTIAPIVDGWKLVNPFAAKASVFSIELREPIIAKGMNVRNLQRCLLSWGYLALMLWILLLAVYFALQQSREGGERKESGVRSQESESRSQNPGDGMAESGERKKEKGFRSQETGDRKPETGERRQETGDRRQESGVRRAESRLNSPEGSPSLPPAECGWRRLTRSVLFLAGIALLFSAVGNRRLIKDAVSYANFRPVPRVSVLRLELKLAVSRPTAAQLFWDTGHGFNEDESLRRRYELTSEVQTLRFDLPRGRPIRALRFDPFDAAGEIRLVGMRVMDGARQTRLPLPVSALRAGHQIAAIEVREDQAEIRTTPDADDPTLDFTPDAVAAISQLITGETSKEAGGKGR